MIATDVPAVQGRVHSVESGATSDGPGIRFVVFLSGCPLRCAYCHNPDAQCLHDGRVYASDELVAEIRRFTPFLRRGRGGLTISGGEPLMQVEFTAALLDGARQLGLHTALDTSGFLGHRAPDALLDAVDLVLLDIKAFTEVSHTALTGVRLEPVLAFARRLADRGQRIWLRYVLVPGLTDRWEEIDGLARFAAGLGVVERVDVLPFHKMGEWKWQARGLPYRLADTPSAPPELVAEARSRFARHGLSTPG